SSKIQVSCGGLCLPAPGGSGILYSPPANQAGYGTFTGQYYCYYRRNRSVCAFISGGNIGRITLQLLTNLAFRDIMPPDVMMGSSSAVTPAREPLVGEKGRGDRYEYITELRTEPPSRAV